MGRVTRLRPLERRWALALGALIVVAGALLVLLPGGRPAPRAPALPQRPPGLGDLWSGRATLALARKWTSASLGMPAGAYEGARVAVVGRTWYLFDRRRLPGSCVARAGVQPMGTQVRASHDAGRTWGAPVPAVMPAPGTPWSCAATDGDAVYDRAANRWRYLFPCQGANGGWAGCYTERRGASPLGPFGVPARTTNPVIDSGALWSRICADPGDRCARAPGAAPIGDEGTFDILPDPAGGWWVSFHGYDGVHGYRGMARTTTFARGDWQVDGAGGTPTDAMLTAADSRGWREDWAGGSAIGPGAASLIGEGGWTYAFVEMPDQNLQCTPGQNWDLGLFRSRTPASTAWAQYPPGNPIVYSSHGAGQTGGCNVQYPSLFRDPADGSTYVMYGRSSPDRAADALYVYRVTWNRNLLVNADLWRADATGWHAWAGTQLEVRRDPDGSPDGTPYMAFNCGGGACGSDASVYQDVRIPPGRGGRRVDYAASLRGDTRAGRADVALIQLDADGREIERGGVAATLGTTWRRVGGHVTLDDRTRALRMQLYPRSPGTLRADDLVVLPR
jgi:hypothetical protein